MVKGSQRPGTALTLSSGTLGFRLCPRECSIPGLAQLVATLALRAQDSDDSLRRAPTSPGEAQVPPSDCTSFRSALSTFTTSVTTAACQLARAGR